MTEDGLPALNHTPGNGQYTQSMDKLKIFLSWSGERSLKVATRMKEWLRDVAPNSEPWLSKEELRKGQLWLPELTNNLASTGFGISVLTPENKDAPWLLFEAGAISKALPGNYCCPVLCGLKDSDLSGPFANFQFTMATDKEDMFKLVRSINDASKESGFEEGRLRRWFDRTWDDFSKDVAEALSCEHTPSSGVTKPHPTQEELLEEILQTVRNLAAEFRANFEPGQSSNGALQDLLNIPNLQPLPPNLYGTHTLQDRLCRGLTLRRFPYLWRALLEESQRDSNSNDPPTSPPQATGE